MRSPRTIGPTRGTTTTRACELTKPEIDRDLSAWRARLDAFVQNLIDLRNHPAYERLRTAADAGATPLEGETALEAATALEAMGCLFQDFELLNQAIQRAEEMRANLPPVFGNGHRLLEIETLLRGLDARCTAPEELFSSMSRSYQAVKQTVERVHAAWLELDGKCEAAAIDLGALRGSGGPELPEVVNAEETLRKLRDLSKGDPLGAQALLGRDVRPAIARAQAAMAERASARKRIDEGLDSARNQLTDLANLRLRAGRAYDERREKIAGGASVPLPDAAEIQGLQDWLTRLEQNYARGLLDPILVGLRNWQAAARNVVAAEQACLDGNRAPLDRRNELRGRFDGLKAKSRALGLAESPALLELGRKADRLLYSAPTAIDDAASAVAS